MQKKYYQIILVWAITMLFPFMSFSQAPIKIVSGISQEVYDQFAADIENNTRVALKTYTTQGSRDNMTFLMSDSIQIAFVQYDVLQDVAKQKVGIDEYIKVFLPLYNEEVHLIAKKNSNIASLEDLSGKKVAMGDVNSGTHVTASIIRSETGFEWKEVNIPFNQSVNALLNDSIDAFFYVGAAPSSYLSGLPAIVANQIQLVDVRHRKLRSIYVNRKIEGLVYNWSPGLVKTIAVRSVLVVNTKNINTETEAQIDILYNDLNDNLKGIQWNKFSHAKWDQVDFGDMENIDWPVYKQEYVTYEVVVTIMAIIAAILSFLQIYFIINKLWKRKHEQVVAESISISAMFISIFINGFFAVKNMGGNNVPQLSANIMWIAASVISAVIGVGLYVSSNRKIGFFRLLLRALNMERKEAGDLAKVFFKPSGAAKIIEILGRVAMVDNDLDKKEEEFIQGFANDWGIKIDWEGIKKYADETENRFQELRRAMHTYLSTSPPDEQASQLIDVISLLVNVDDVVTEEEDLMLSELTGQIMKYLGKGSDVDVYKVAVVPQSTEQEIAIEALLKDLNKEFIAGGWAYISEAYYSERYAGIISAQYRAFRVFSVVFKPNKIEELERFVSEKEE